MAASTLPEPRRRVPRERILEAARVLFGARGFETVTMAEIAARAGVARATVFNQFSSKHALVEAITAQVLRAYGDLLEGALAAEETPTPELVRALFDGMGAGIESFYGFYRGVFREIVRIQVGLEEGGEAAAARARALASLRRLLARGQARGELSRDHAAEDLASAFDSLANGTIVHWLYDDPSGSLRERMGRAVEIFLGAVSTPRPGHPRSARPARERGRAAAPTRRRRTPHGSS